MEFQGSKTCPLRATLPCGCNRTEGALRSTTKHIPGAPESMSRLFIILTFVWLFGALVSMRAIDYDLQEIFWDLAGYQRAQILIFMSVLPREVGDPGVEIRSSRCFLTNLQK